MKTCMLTSSYPKYPGETTAPFIEEIAAGLAQRLHEVHVVAPYHPELRRASVERGVNLHFYRYSPSAALNVWGYAASLHADVGLRWRALAAAPLALGASALALLRLTADDRQTTADDRPSNNGRGSSAASSAVGRRSSLRPAPARPFDVVHAHWVLPNGPPAALAAGLRGLPLVISLHGSDVFLAERNPAFALMAAAALRAAAAVTACSSELADRALRLGAPADRLTVIPYGVDPGAFHPDSGAGAAVRAELGLLPDTPLIVSIGRLVYKKGLTYLLDAFPSVLALHPRAVLVIAGYGDLRDALVRQARELGVDRHVRFPGQLARERAARYIAAADVFVVPSIRDQKGNIDGLPNTLLEGMAAARPVVASRVAGIPDVIADGCHGLLVPERDSSAIAAGTARLLADRALAERLGAAARERIVRDLTWEMTSARFEQVYRRALAGGRRDV